MNHFEMRYPENIDTDHTRFLVKMARYANRNLRGPWDNDDLWWGYADAWTSALQDYLGIVDNRRVNGHYEALRIASEGGR